VSFYQKNIANLIDTKGLLRTIKSAEGDRRSYDPEFFNLAVEGFKEVSDNWANAKYDPSSIEWFNYYSGVHFSNGFTKEFASMFNAEPIKVWVSEIRPGKCFPYHWDVDTDTSKYVEGKMVRYHMHLDDYKFGHFFVLENEYLSGYKAGDVYRWSDYRVWHGGGNIGETPKYIFNFLGIDND